MKRKKKIILWVLGLCLTVGLWVLGDFTYSRMILREVAEWEATIERNADGVQAGAEPFLLEGGNTVFLLVHGFNDTPRTFKSMARELHKQGFSVRAIRLDGFGVPVQQSHECTGKQWVHSVVTEGNRLRQKYEQVFLVGHSLGAAIAIGSLIESSDLFDGVVLLAPAIKVSDRRSPILPTRAWRRIGDFLLMFSNVYKSPYDRNDCRDPEQKNPPHKSPFSTRNIVQQTFQLMDQNRDKAPLISIPVLMVLSRDDQIIDWVAAETWFGQLASSNKQLEFFDTSGHALTVDYDWKNVTNSIARFANSVVDESQKRAARE